MSPPPTPAPMPALRVLYALWAPHNTFHLYCTAVLFVQSASTVLGQILALTWTLRTDAALFKPGPEAMQLTKEAYALADKEESVLLSRLPGRALTLELVGALRVAALELLDLLVAWDPYKAFGEQVCVCRVCVCPCICMHTCRWEKILRATTVVALVSC